MLQIVDQGADPCGVGVELAEGTSWPVKATSRVYAGDRFVTPEEFSKLYPSLFHMAAEGSWQQIRRHGLLSTSAVLDLLGVSGARRRQLEEEPRAGLVVLEDESAGRFVLRDQKPLHPGKLSRCLVDMTVTEWLRLLNGKVFFWPTRRRCEQLLTARAYRAGAHTVVEVDTASLLERHGGRVSLSPINTGSVLYNPPARGRFTFVPLAEVAIEDWRRRRHGHEAVAEVAVDCAVPDVTALVRSVYRVEQGEWTRIRARSSGV